MFAPKLCIASNNSLLYWLQLAITDLNSSLLTDNEGTVFFLHRKPTDRTLATVQSVDHKLYLSFNSQTGKLEAVPVS